MSAPAARSTRCARQDAVAFMNVTAQSRARLGSGKPRPSRLRDTCQARGFGAPAALGLALLVSCARSGLDMAEVDPVTLGARGGSAGATPTATAAQAGATGKAGAPSSAGAPNKPASEPTCTPEPETCNGRDDDCNGEVDELPAEPCPGGGFRYCVAGQLSSCPRSCQACIPGSVRICQNTYCTFWGEQECTADGQGFGPCRERRPPPNCAGVASEGKDSPELEQCCIDDGYCCVDSHDLDGDGDHHDMVGACQGVVCP